MSIKVASSSPKVALEDRFNYFKQLINNNYMYVLIRINTFIHYLIDYFFV